MDEENLTATNDNPENDVEMINKTIPEIVIGDTSFDDSKNDSGDRANTKEESFVTETAPAEIAHTTHSATDATFDEEQLIDMVVVDDDDDFSPLVKGVKREPKCSSDAHPNNEILDTKPNLSPPQKFEANVKDVKDENAIETNPNSSKSPPSLKPPKDDIFLVHCAIRQSLSNETFVLQLDSSDALDSYLDQTAKEPLEEKSINNLGSTANEGGEAGDMKENDSNQLNVAASKATESEKVCDALILTADDELQTELSLEEKHSKALSKGLGQDKSAVSGQLSAAPKLQTDTNMDSKLVIPKTEPTESAMEVAEKDDSSKEKEPNKNPVLQDKPENKSGFKKTDAPATNNKPRNVLPTTSRILWVSNVTQSVRASDLKQYITRIGKVATAKIVTDGKKCYGYVVMDNSEDASKCLKTLNNAYFEGRKISLSFTRPPRTDKKEDPSKLADGDKFKPAKIESSFGSRTSGNETDDAKVRKSKERNTKVSKGDTRKRHRSHSRSLSGRVGKRQTTNDPLTTKFDGRKRARSGSRRKSRSCDRHDRKCLREKEERERLQRNLLEEQRRNRDEMLKQIEREEKHREMEFKLEQERRKLQLERELFEKERRELTRLDLERRKIERERLEVLKQRSKLQEELQKSRMKQKPDKFSLSSVIGKPQESSEYEKRKEALKRNDDYNRKPPSAKHPFQKTVKNCRDERKISNDSKSSTASSSHRTMPKPDRMDFKSIKDASKAIKSYEKIAPPPPKLTNDFDRKPKHSERKHEYPDGKPSYVDRKSERGARKIEVIERKYYQERASEAPDRKHERIYRKPEFDGRKPHMFPERKYDYGRDAKRYPDENYPERDTTQRIQWPAASVNYNDPWKAVPAGPVSGSSAARYQEPNFPASSYGGPSRITPFYYHPTPTPQEYPRYDHCSQILVALRFYAAGSYQLDTGSNYHLAVSQSSVSRCIKEVSDALNQPVILNRWVHFPRNLEQLESLRRRFYENYGFPGVVGCLDCTHVAICPPKKNDPVYPEHIYVNRKNYHSINVQLVCDWRLKILNVNARYPGSTHDSFIWSNSNLHNAMVTLHRRYPNSFCLLGDSGYPLRPWLLTPLTENVQPNSPEERYNNCQKSTRSIIERCNGVLKMRFRCLLT